MDIRGHRTPMLCQYKSQQKYVGKNAKRDIVGVKGHFVEPLLPPLMPAKPYFISICHSQQNNSIQNENPVTSLVTGFLVF